MIWQELVFLLGSASSIVVLGPTIRDASARVPRGTSIPSAGLGVLYAITFATMDMTVSAAGALLTGVLWSLIAVLRSPDDGLVESVLESESESTAASTGPAGD